MLDTVRPLFEQSPMLALFATIGLGYALGRITVAGFSLDIGAVLFEDSQCGRSPAVPHRRRSCCQVAT